MTTSFKINIIYRACDVVNAVNKDPRPFGFDKTTLVKICFKSLYNSIQGYNYKLIVLGDKLSAELRAFFLRFDVEIIEGDYGNDNSIREAFTIAQKFDENEWVYFCEDDYLHTPDFFKKSITLVKENGSIKPGKIQFKIRLRKQYLNLITIPRFFTPPAIVIHPCDYPDRYTEKGLLKSFIFTTSDSHWRQVPSTTFTFMIKCSDLKKHYKKCMRAAHRANDQYLSAKLYGKTFFFNKLLCLSPVPSLASHMHVSTLSPMMEHNKLVEDIKKEIDVMQMHE
jgi:hypothetical protein